MSQRSLLIAFLGLLAAAMAFFAFNKPRPFSFPFSVPIQQKADYRPPVEGVTLYPTEGPFGIGVIQAIAAGAGETLFVGTYGEGLFRSKDGGAHWMPANQGLKDKFIVNLTRLPGDILFAGTIRAGLFISRDDGDHWASANHGLENTEIQSMASLPGGRIFAGTGEGVYISRDEGGHWEPFNEGLNDVLVRGLVAAKDQTLYAATQGRGLFRRKPGEEKWIQVIRGFFFEGIEERIVRALVLGRNEALFAGTLGAGIFRTLDGGAHWETANAGLKSLSIRSLSVDGAGVLYAGSGEGVFYSEDDGASWSPLTKGMTNNQIHSFVTNEEGILYAGTREGLFRGRIQSPWESLHQGLLISPIQTLDYGEEGITVGTEGKGTYINLQDNWASDNLGLVNLVVRAMARGKIFLYIVTGDGIYRRQLGRHRWERVEGTLPADPLSIGVDETDQVYVGTAAGLYRSSDHGKRWENVGEIPAGPITGLTSGEEGILAIASKGIWAKSPGADGGWKEIIPNQGGPIQHAVWRKGKGILAATDHAIWEGSLEGEWRATAGEFLPGTTITSLAVSPSNNNLIYAGSDRGLFWSPDGGQEWHLARLYQGELFEKQVNQVLPTETRALWLATEEDGVILGIEKIGRSNWLKRWFK